MTTTVFDPVLVASYFCKKEPEGGVGPILAEKLAKVPDLQLKAIREEEEARIYRSDDGRSRLDWFARENVEVTRLSLANFGESSPQAWFQLGAIVQGLFGGALASAAQGGPFGISFLYWATVEDGTNLLEILQEGTKVRPDQSLFSCHLPCGELWEVNERGSDGVRLLEYALLSPKSLTSVARDKFVYSAKYGFTWLQLHLHEGYSQVDEYQQLRTALLAARERLERESLVVLRTGSQAEQLSRLGRQLAENLEMKIRVDGLLNKLRLALVNYGEHYQLLEPVDDRCFALHRERLERAIQRVEWDLSYCNATVENVGPSLEIQRGAQVSQIERLGFILEVSVVVVAAFATYNTFMDIWSTAVVDSGLRLPHPLLRIELALMIAATLPLSLYWWLLRRRRQAIIVSLFALAAIIVAVVSTLFANM
jgi:hypothetical protein